MTNEEFPTKKKHFVWIEQLTELGRKIEAGKTSFTEWQINNCQENPHECLGNQMIHGKSKLE